MDKNTITGLVLIAILLVGFSFLSRPSKEQLEAQQRYYDSIALVQQREEALKAKADAWPMKKMWKLWIPLHSSSMPAKEQIRLLRFRTTWLS